MRIATLGELEHQRRNQRHYCIAVYFQDEQRGTDRSFNYMNAVENATSLQTKDFAARNPNRCRCL